MERTFSAVNTSPYFIVVDYKGLTRYRDTAVNWLSTFDDGAVLAPGTQPE